MLLEKLIKEIFEARARELRDQIQSSDHEGDRRAGDFVNGRLSELNYLAGQFFGSEFAESL